ncbi:MAG: TIGR03792 family protein [Leptolyngbyaceae cyanobacterium bins.59]|nr:TIGR03792 family protein [Leptolyngbyaceae cyanobacterium bins.59]
MVIEWLRVQVPAEVRETYVKTDAEIWTRFLETCPGFLGKEVWLNLEKPEEVVFMIRWESLELWQSIPQRELERVDREFTAAMGASYPIVEFNKYQIRKFSSA